VEKKAPEHCSHWNLDSLLEVASEIDLLFDTNNPASPPSKALIAAHLTGFADKPGIVVLFGGDHGAGNCPCSLKLNFSSPQARKERGELNWRCPAMQIASIECTKDSFELLSSTIMTMIKTQLINLRNCSACVVHSRRDPRKTRKTFLLPKELQTTSVQNDHLVCSVRLHQRAICLAPHFNVEFGTNGTGAFSSCDLSVIKVISNFNDLRVGDLAFLSVAIGVNNSSGAHCMHCEKKAREFNSPVQQHDMRTKASLTESLNQHIAKSLTRKSVCNHLGVNALGLLDIDPQHTTVPMLHCPMGLADKVLEAFEAWAILDAEHLPDEAAMVRTLHNNKRDLHAAAKITCELSPKDLTTQRQLSLLKQQHLQQRTERRKEGENKL